MNKLWIFIGLLCAASADAGSLPQRYAVAEGSVIATINTGISGLAVNTKAYGSGTTAGTDNTDSAYFKDASTTKNVKVVIDGTAGATAHNTDWTISKVFFSGAAPTVGLWLYFPVAANVSGCTIMLTADNYTNYFQANMNGIQTKRDGWNFFAPHKLDFTVGGGSPSWSSTMTKMRLQCEGANTVVTTYYIDQNYTGFYARPQVVFTFDDNEATIFTVGQPILDAKGWKATLFSQGQRIDANGYGTLAQHRAWRTAGHEIYSHTQTHVNLTAVPSTQAAAEIVAGQSTIDRLGLTSPGPQCFAYPFGNFNDTIKGILRGAGFVCARAVGGSSATPYLTIKGYEFDEYQIEATELNNGVTLAQAQAEVDQAIKYGGTVVFLVHAFVASSPGASSWVTSDFQALCSYIQAREALVTVRPFGNWFAGHVYPRRSR